MKPGDIIGLRSPASRLYKHPGPTNEQQGNPITGVLVSGEVGMVLATTVSRGQKDTDPDFNEVLVLFGERLGWREATEFEVLDKVKPAKRDLVLANSKDVRPQVRERLKPGDLARYKGDISMLAKQYEPKERVVGTPVGLVQKGDMVLVLGVMPQEMFVLNQRMEIGWVVSTFFERLR